MTKNEVLDRLSDEGLRKLLCDGHIIEYIDEDDVYYDNSLHSKPNTFGVYHKQVADIYVFFVTDDERGTLYYHSNHKTEDEAYTAMYKFIVRAYRAFNK